MTEPLVAIVLVNWNGWSDTVACIRSCLALDHRRRRIIVCDNASADGSVDRIVAWARGDLDVPADPAAPLPLDPALRPRGVVRCSRAAAEAGEDGAGAELIVVDTGGNLGFAGGNNVGLRWALATGCDYAWLLNNDALAAPDALSALLEPFAADRACGLAGSVLLEYDRPGTIQALAGAMDMNTFAGRHLARGMVVEALAIPGAADAAQRLPAGHILYPVGASMLASRDWLTHVGLMGEGYFLYYEEADWVLRGRGQYAIRIAPGSHVYHKHGASAGSSSDGRSVRATGFLYRSRLLAAGRHAPGRLGAVRRAIAWEALKGLLKGRTAKAQAAFAALRSAVSIPPEARGTA